MVVLSEMPSSSFWGLTLTSGKKYTQKVERTFHVSMAALEHIEGGARNDNIVSVMIQQEKGNFVVCTLQYGKLFQQPIDLQFLEDEEVTFYLAGQGTVHLTGYVMEDVPDYDPSFEASDDNDSDALSASSEDDDDEDSETETPDKHSKNKKNKLTLSSKKRKLDSSDDEDDEDDLNESELIDGEAEESDEEENEDDSDANEVTTPSKAVKQSPESQQKKKKLKLDKSAKKSNGNQSVTSVNTSVSKSDTSLPAEDGDKKKKKKKNKKNKEASEEKAAAPTAVVSPQLSKTPKKRTLEGGIIVEDLTEGSGPVAKQGKLVNVYYTGRLPNGTLFDEKKSGNGFKFKIGKSEVIRGWDLGVAGMKVGGKRRLIVPPKLAYGAQRVGSIPANSTLHFDIELKAVH